MDIDMLVEYQDFVLARHEVWARRQAGEPAPWTDHPIVRSYKFTNVFRILDYGTQFLMTELLEPGLPPRDTLMRCFLYRHTGRVEAWEYLALMGPGYPTVDNLPEVLEAWREYGSSVFTGAYLVFPQSHVKGTNKTESIVDLATRLFTPGGSQDIWPAFSRAESASVQFQTLRAPKGVGDFMAMQTLTDWGYSRYGGDRENEMVVCGPGARKGAAYLDPRADPNRLVHELRNQWLDLANCPRLPGGRPPSLMDVQNTMCEFSKLVRYLGKGPREPYTPAHPGPQPDPVLPEHWAH